MVRSTAKKATAKKTDPLAAVRADTPNPEATDLDRDPACVYCGRDAVAKLPEKGGALVCAVHEARARTRGQEAKKL